MMLLEYPAMKIGDHMEMEYHYNNSEDRNPQEHGLLQAYPYGIACI